MLDSLSRSLWQVAVGAAHPKHLVKTTTALSEKAPPAAQSRRPTSGGPLSLTTVGEVRVIEKCDLAQL